MDTESFGLPNPVVEKRGDRMSMEERSQMEEGTLSISQSPHRIEEEGKETEHAGKTSCLT